MIYIVFISLVTFFAIASIACLLGVLCDKDCQDYWKGKMK